MTETLLYLGADVVLMDAAIELECAEGVEGGVRGGSGNSAGHTSRERGSCGLGKRVARSRASTSPRSSRRRARFSLALSVVDVEGSSACVGGSVALDDIRRRTQQKADAERIEFNESRDAVLRDRLDSALRL